MVAHRVKVTIKWSQSQWRTDTDWAFVPSDKSHSIVIRRQ